MDAILKVFVRSSSFCLFLYFWFLYQFSLFLFHCFFHSSIARFLPSVCCCWCWCCCASVRVMLSYPQYQQQPFISFSSVSFSFSLLTLKCWENFLKKIISHEIYIYSLLFHHLSIELFGKVGTKPGNGTLHSLCRCCSSSIGKFAFAIRPIVPSYVNN